MSKYIYILCIHTNNTRSPTHPPFRPPCGGRLGRLGRRLGRLGRRESRRLNITHTHIYIHMCLSIHRQRHPHLPFLPPCGGRLGRLGRRVLRHLQNAAAGVGAGVAARGKAALCDCLLMGCRVCVSERKRMVATIVYIYQIHVH